MNPYPILSDPYHDTTQAALASIHPHAIEQQPLHGLPPPQQQLHHHLHHQTQPIMHAPPLPPPPPPPQSHPPGPTSQSSPLSQPSYDIVQDLQHQLDDSRQLQDQYQIRIQRLMELVEKQTSIISDLRQQLLNKQQPQDHLTSIQQAQQQQQ